MPKNTTPSFITELPLIVSSQIERELMSRFQAGRHLYNACLTEAMVRVRLVQNSEFYKQAKALPRTIKKGKKNIPNPERKKLFTQAWKKYRFSEYELHSFATKTAKSAKWIAAKVDSNTQQKLATRAFNTAKKVLFGIAKKVRYKVATRFRSVEGKTNKSGIRWKQDQLIWMRLKIKADIDWLNPVIKHGLDSKIKYIRILWREIKGKRRWYVQLINEGLPYQKPQNYVSEGLIGLDLNVSNIAFVADKKAGLLPFAENVPTYQKEIIRLQRKMERSRRSNNLDNYHPNMTAKKGRKTVIKKGKLIKGKRAWNNSKTYYQIAAKKRELERKKAAYSKSQNRKIINEILRHGNKIKTENVSVKGWQKRYGKAIRDKSPGFVQSELKRKAESAGGSFQKFSTRKTALSQTHLDGTRIKKALSERVHRDSSGFEMHRDLFSAFLARHINDDECLSMESAQQEWGRSESILRSAWQTYQINREQVAQKCGLGGFPHEQLLQDGKSESRLCHSSSERFDH
ncbi:MAG: transposase [Xenococcaceae cyanobacterium MO_167.B27]|nr:transposase [Xenococcaceae cyanobacterium MO_167.B27]